MHVWDGVSISLCRSIYFPEIHTEAWFWVVLLRKQHHWRQRMVRWREQWFNHLAFHLSFFFFIVVSLVSNGRVSDKLVRHLQAGCYRLEQWVRPTLLVQMLAFRQSCLHSWYFPSSSWADWITTSMMASIEPVEEMSCNIYCGSTAE